MTGPSPRGGGGSLGDSSPGQTPLTDDETAGLLLPIETRADLDQQEAANIASARRVWLNPRRRLTLERLCTQDRMRALHRDMFGDVWSWAGTYRTSERNLGVPHHQIVVELQTLIDDVPVWVDSMDGDEICVRLSHRAVSIHPFPNGNGRWSRTLADVAALALGLAPYAWGASTLRVPDESRAAYLAALRVADNSLNYGPLSDFARS
jgi:Fic-DOC domain mobile mystery protein B